MSSNGLEINLSKFMSEYKKEFAESVETAMTETAKETVALLKETSPKKTGDYAKGWTMKKNGKDIVVYNKTRPSLTHLLENGHPLRNGGRARAFKHIEPAEKFAQETFEKKLKEKLDA